MYISVCSRAFVSLYNTIADPAAHFIARKKITTLKKIVTVQIPLTFECNSATPAGNPTTSVRGRCATAYRVGNRPAVDCGYADERL